MTKVRVQFTDGRIQEVPAREAKVLVVLGRASLVPETPPTVKVPRPRAARTAGKPKAKRTYRRRDLQAEE